MAAGVAAGARCGISDAGDNSVDGMPFGVSAAVLEEIRAAVLAMDDAAKL